MCRNFLLSDCLRTFSAVVEHAGSARSSLIQNYNVTRTCTCGAGHEATRRQVFNRQVTVCAPAPHLYSAHYVVQLCLYEEAFFICQRTRVHFQQLIRWHSRNHCATYRGSAHLVNHISRLYALFFTTPVYKAPLQNLAIINITHLLVVLIELI